MLDVLKKGCQTTITHARSSLKNGTKLFFCKCQMLYFLGTEKCQRQHWPKKRKMIYDDVSYCTFAACLLLVDVDWRGLVSVMCVCDVCWRPSLVSTNVEGGRKKRNPQVSISILYYAAKLCRWSSLKVLHTVLEQFVTRRKKQPNTLPLFSMRNPEGKRTKNR